MKLFIPNSYLSLPNIFSIFSLSLQLLFLPLLFPPPLLLPLPPPVSQDAPLPLLVPSPPLPLLLPLLPPLPSTLLLPLPLPRHWIPSTNKGPSDKFNLGKIK